MLTGVRLASYSLKKRTAGKPCGAYISTPSMTKKHASPAMWIAAAASTEDVAALAATATIMTAMPKRVIILTLSFFVESNIVLDPYSFFASHPRKTPPWSKEMIVKKISANRMKTKDGIRIRVYFFPKAVPFLIALPMPER